MRHTLGRARARRLHQQAATVSRHSYEPILLCMRSAQASGRSLRASSARVPLNHAHHDPSVVYAPPVPLFSRGAVAAIAAIHTGRMCF